MRELHKNMTQILKNDSNNKLLKEVSFSQRGYNEFTRSSEITDIFYL